MKIKMVYDILVNLRDLLSKISTTKKLNVIHKNINVMLQIDRHKKRML